MGFFARHLMLLFGVVRPGYLTYLDFNKDGPGECSGWIKYWIVYALITSALYVTDLLLFWFPFYEVAKILTIIFLTLGAPRNGIRMYDFFFTYLLVVVERYFKASALAGTTNELYLSEMKDDAEIVEEREEEEEEGKVEKNPDKEDKLHLEDIQKKCDQSLAFKKLSGLEEEKMENLQLSEPEMTPNPGL